MPYTFDDILEDPPQTSDELEQWLGLSTQPEPTSRRRIERTAEQDAATLRWLKASRGRLTRVMIAGTYTGDAEVQE